MLLIHQNISSMSALSLRSEGIKNIKQSKPLIHPQREILIIKVGLTQSMTLNTHKLNISYSYKFMNSCLTIITYKFYISLYKLLMCVLVQYQRLYIQV